MIIPNEIIEYFSAKNIEVSFLVPDVINDVENPINQSVKKFIDSINIEILDNFLADKNNSFMCESYSKEATYYNARIGYISKIIKEEIVKRRIYYICKENYEEIPLPYNHPELKGILIDKNYLVSLPELKNRPLKTVFQILPSLPQLNSMYWCKQHLEKLNDNVAIYIRLDPFMHEPIETYREMFYKMLVYGAPLDWEDITNLREDRHARWMPSALTSDDVDFTDLVWSPRSDGIHFICEEVPKQSAIELRGSRYFHGIYNPENLYFSHFDGAIRFYKDSEILERKKHHVRNLGKLGKRVKIFQVNSIVDRDSWCNIAASFFIWNQDVIDYFNT